MQQINVNKGERETVKEMDIVFPLLKWYSKSARTLPWRERPEPYNVWISEIMLQQTRVEAVKPYFERFLKEFPNIGELARAEEDRLLKAWEGLGYYNRVKNMQKAAVLVMEQYGGKLPEEYEELLKLPGIGPYTAGAISSIAYGKVHPAVDGNVLRVMTRLLADDRNILSQKVKNDIGNMLYKIMPKDKPGDFNQALMELGATVCLPNKEPLCGQCPWSLFCKAKEEEAQSEYPKRAEKKSKKIEKMTVLIIRDGEKIVLRKRPGEGLLAGMYEFPNLEGHRKKEEALLFVKEIGMSPVRIQELEGAKHIFSHKEWQMIGYMIRVEELGVEEQEGLIFAHSKEMEERYPIPTAFGAYTKYMKIRLGNEKYEQKEIE